MSIASVDVDPAIPAHMTNVAENGFEVMIY